MINDIIKNKLKYFNDYARDENGDVNIEGGKIKQFVQNLLEDSSLEVIEDETYLDYDVRLHSYSGKRKNNSSEESLGIECILGLEPYFPYHLLQLPESKDSDFNYVSSAIDLEQMRAMVNCTPNNMYFISAGTGKGKNVFIKEQLLKKYTGSGKVVILENRESLLSQQIKDVVGSIDAEALKYNHDNSDNMIIFGENNQFMLVSYQAAAQKLLSNDWRFSNYIAQAEYIVFDEAHYLLDDSSFNRGINTIVKKLLFPGNIIPFANKIFMSASIEEVFLFLQYTDILPEFKTETKDPQNDIVLQDMSVDKRRIDLKMAAIMSRSKYMNKPEYLYLNLPTDYSYITPFVYDEYKSLYDRIKCSSDKWLILVDSIDRGYEISEDLNVMCGEGTAFFINADNKDKRTIKELYRNMLENEKFDYKVLIATSVIYNGINIKDKALKNIVVPETSISVIKQVIGRKRISENDKELNVYFPSVNEKQIYKKLLGKIQDYLNIGDSLIGNVSKINNSIPISKYMCCEPGQYNSMAPFTFSNYVENIPATMKLHFDTMYYLYLYRRIHNDEQAYIRSILEYMKIPEKLDNIEFIVTAEKSNDSDSLDKTSVIADFISLLEEYAGKSPIEDKRNDSKQYTLIPAFTEKLDELYMKMNNTKEHFDDHFKTRTRTVSSDKINTLLEKHNIPYHVEITEYDKKKSSKTLIVSRKER